jgi:hypothetical protein
MAAEINLQQNCQISERNINFSQNNEQKTSTGVILKVNKRDVNVSPAFNFLAHCVSAAVCRLPGYRLQAVAYRAKSPINCRMFSQRQVV